MNATTSEPVDHQSSGWVTFAGIMILVLATMNIIGGLAAIDQASFWVGDAKFIVSNLKTWGWILLGIGLIQLLVAFGIWSGAQWARWTGILIASLNAIAQLLFISAFPLWSLAIFAIDILVIYGLAAHGGRGRASLA
jgi:hypothetical protein